MGENIRDWFDLPCVVGLRKSEQGGLVVWLKDVVIGGLQRDGLAISDVGGSWLCRDEIDRWWLLRPVEYDALDDEQHVTLFPNQQTHAQVAAIKAIDKLKREIESLPRYQQAALYNEFPDLFIKTIVTEENV